jgi:hypothetical protein
MSEYWETAASRTNGLNKPEDFEQAAYRLVTEQVLYHSDKSSRTAYALIERYIRDFQQALNPLGLVVEVNRTLQYAYAKPLHARQGSAPVSLTLLALVLRAAYDDAMRAGMWNDQREVLLDAVELDAKHEMLTGRKLPPKMELDILMRQLKRSGIAQWAERATQDDGEESCIPIVLIRPGIVDILGEAALQQLGHWSQVKTAQQMADEGEQA